MKVEENLEPYTVKELLERAEEGRRQIAMGNYTDIEDVLRELDKLGLPPRAEKTSKGNY